MVMFIGSAAKTTLHYYSLKNIYIFLVIINIKNKGVNTPLLVTTSLHPIGKCLQSTPLLSPPPAQGGGQVKKKTPP